MIRVIHVNPAGNITAIVRGSVKAEHRISIAKNIMQANPEVEQVGFEVSSVMGGDCRLEMMGGEFCGNATRAFGYLIMKEQCPGDHSGSRYEKVNNISVEISGANAPVEVHVDLHGQSAYTDMPLPIGVEYLSFSLRSGVPGSEQMCSCDAPESEQMCSRDVSEEFPLVKMDGIAHLILKGIKPDPEIVSALLKQLKQYYSEDAYGILFLEEESENQRMTPLVYVCKTETMVWESSCGSGTTACTWYMMQKHLADKKDGNYPFTFQEPGGILKTDVEIKDHQITHIWMGGAVHIGETQEMRGYYEVP